ncbi:MAG: NMD3-related protein [Candidatus Thermoplasmatota archaeon]
MFCVECGKEGKTYNGLCLDCYLKKELIRIPDEVKITFCKGCDAYKIKDKWLRGNFNEDLEDYIRKNIEANIFFEIELEDNLVICRGFFEGKEILKEKEIKIKIKEGLCNQCSLFRGGYYEAVLQIRGADEKEKKIIDEFIKRNVETKKTFISKKLRVRGGIDYYIGNKKVASNIAKELKEEFNAEYIFSSSLFGVKNGKRVYRDTHLIRLPEYKVNDFINFEGNLYRIVSIGKRIEIEGINGEKRIIYRNEIRFANKVDVNKRKGILVHEDENGIYVMDEKTYRTIFFNKPKNWEKGKEIKIFEWEGNFYLLIE